MSPTVAVIGGGVAGLAAARRLAAKTRPGGGKVVLFEAAPAPGGKVRTLLAEVPGTGRFVVEAGPDSFLTRKPEVLRLLEEEHLLGELIPTLGGAHGSYVYFGGRPRRLPEGLVLMVPGRISALLATDLLSPLGKARALLDLVIPGRPAVGDESLASFVRRRLGSEVLERVAEPLIAGVHAAEPETMSLEASFPRMLEMERRHGSLIRAALSGRKSPPPPLEVGGVRLSYFMSLAGGMGDLASAMERSIPDVDIHTGTPVASVTATEGGVVLTTAAGPLAVAGVVVATPSREAARLLTPVAADAARGLADLRAIGAATASFAWPRQAFGRPLLGHGFVVPRSEGRRIMGVTYSSLKWQGRSPTPEAVLVRVFVGGAHGQEPISRGEDAVRKTALAEIRDMLGVAGEPLLDVVALWPEGMPQYVLGHLGRVAEIEADLGREAPAVRLAGAPYHGIGVPDCIGSGERAADALWAHLEGAGAAGSK